MAKDGRSKPRQAELFARSRRSAIAVDVTHPLVRIAELVDWDELIERAEQIRSKRVKSRAGRPPRLRALLGAMVLRATRHMSFREAEDQIRYYAPARYLCGLSESEWTPDHDTIHEFTQTLGEEGIALLNDYVVKLAVEKKLADPSVVVGDTTAQEAAIPYPSEMRLMAAFVTALGVASKRAGGALRQFLTATQDLREKVLRKIRRYHLFPKEKKERNAAVLGVARDVATIQRHLARVLPDIRVRSGIAAAASNKVNKLHSVMSKLLPQIRYWIRTGHVAKGKVISLHMPELYSIVRGKAGKPVEFGLKWGFTRLRGGYLLASTSEDKLKMEDKRFVERAVDEHIERFGVVPRAYAYDRGGFSYRAVKALRRKGVRHPALAPTGKADWPVGPRIRKEMIRERAAIESGIGCVKHPRYGFNKPNVRSTRMMKVAGQLSVFGFNIAKLGREAGPA
jgi:IS5 family transposase